MYTSDKASSAYFRGQIDAFNDALKAMRLSGMTYKKERRDAFKAISVMKNQAEQMLKMFSEIETKKNTGL